MDFIMSINAGFIGMLLFIITVYSICKAVLLIQKRKKQDDDE
jgi:hypothetical protein